MLLGEATLESFFCSGCLWWQLLVKLYTTSVDYMQTKLHMVRDHEHGGWMLERNALLPFVDTGTRIIIVF